MPALARAILVIACAMLMLILAYANWYEISQWVQGMQRAMQAQLAVALQAVRSGDRAAIATLLTACFTYGVLHAVGPGHGKVLVGGAAVASRRTAVRMATIGFSASLLQAVSAIALAYGSLGFLSATGSAIIGNANKWLVPMSFVLMALVGLWIAIRGVRLLFAPVTDFTEPGSAHANETVSQGHTGHDAHAHGHGCGSSCKHMPTVHEIEEMESWRDIGALMLSIGVRPCSGALIVLIISWQLGLHLIGALGAFAMAVGTGLIVGLIAVLAATVRDAGFFRLSAEGDAISVATFGWLQVVAGGVIAVICAAFLLSGVSVAVPTGIVR